MRMRGRKKISRVMLLFALLVGCAGRWGADVTPRMAKEELRSLLGKRDVIIVDVRIEDEWKASKWKIAGAVREDPEKDGNTWAAKYPREKILVFYCS